MRTLSLMFVVMFLFIGGKVWAQEKKKDAIITISPFAENTYPEKHLKGSTVKFKISNVNFLKIKNSKVESKGVNYFYETTNGLQQLLKEAGKSKEKLTVLENDTSAQLLIENQKDNHLFSKDFLSLYNRFLKELSLIESAVNLEEELKNLIGDDVFIKDTSSIQTKATLIYDYVYNEDQDIFYKINMLRSSFSELKEAYLLVNDSSQNIIQTTLDGELKSKNKTVVKITDAKMSQTLQNKYHDEFELAKKNMTVFDDESKMNELIKKAKAGKALYYTIKRNDFIHYTGAIQLNDDFVTLTPKLHDADNKVIHEFEPLTIKTKTGVRVNFSTGYLLSFRGDEEYGYRRDLTDSIVGVNSLGNSNLTHGIGALVHVLRDCGANTQFGVSSGISLNANSKVNFHFGVSAGFVEANRLVFTFGGSLVNVKELDRSNLDAKNNFVSPKRTDINYIEHYKRTFFFGITYNLVNKK